MPEGGLFEPGLKKGIKVAWSKFHFGFFRAFRAYRVKSHAQTGPHPSMLGFGVDALRSSEFLFEGTVWALDQFRA